jgi:integrase
LDHTEKLVSTGRRAQATADYYGIKVGQLVRLLEPEDGPPRLLVTLCASDIDAYVDERREDGAMDTTIGKELGALKRALRLSKRAGIWKGDTEELFPELEGYVPRERWLPPDELRALLAQLQPDRAARVAFIVATSARWSESDRAERGDVEKHGTRLRGTKTADAKRKAPQVIAELETLVKYAAKHGDGAGDKLFQRWPNARRDIAAACERAGIERCSPNDLRRTYTHWMRQAGVPADLVASCMGHVDSRMVERVYGKMRGDELVGAVARSVTRVSQPPQRRQDRTDSPDRKTARKSEKVVPRVGIEPTTRGFSIRAKSVVSWPKPKESRIRRHTGVTATAAKRGAK